MQQSTESVLKAESEASGLLRDFFSEEQLARELEIGRKSLHRWHREGRGPERIKLGKRVYYKRSAVAVWLSSLTSGDRKSFRQSRVGLRTHALRARRAPGDKS
jgi:predicted DNA-binding transcriptional regulator AlpA